MVSRVGIEPPTRQAANTQHGSKTDYIAKEQVMSRTAVSGDYGCGTCDPGPRSARSARAVALLVTITSRSHR